MAWIESHQSLSRHRKTLEAVTALRVDRHKFIGHLHELWWWALDNADTDGVIGDVPPKAIADAAGWPVRDANRFVQALTDVKFLSFSQSLGFSFHDWSDYAGKLNTQRELRKAANRDAQRRRRDRLSSPGQHDVSMTGADGHDDIDDSQHPTGPDQPNQPNRTGPDPSPLPPFGPPEGGGDESVTMPDIDDSVDDATGLETCPECGMLVARDGAGHGISQLPGRLRNCSLDHLAPHEWAELAGVEASS